MFALQPSTAAGALTRRGHLARLAAAEVAGSPAPAAATSQRRPTVELGVREVRLTGDRAPLLLAYVSLHTYVI